jgi:O-antigen/teichoic acid export membrane protein
MTSHQAPPRRGSTVRSLINLGLGQAATTVLSILLTIILARALGASEFGLLYLLTSIAGFAYVVVDWGHAAFIIRETARHPDRAGNLLGSAMVLRSVAVLIVCVVAVAMTWLFGYDLRTRVLTAALILAALPQSLGLSFCWIFRGHQRMDRDALLNVAFKLATLISAAACLALGGRIPGLILASLIAGCLTFALGISMYWKLQLPTLSATLSTARELLRDGVPLLAISVAGAVEPFLNTNILYKLASPTVVGWYGAAASITGTLIAPATILGGALYPRFSIAANDTGEFARVFNSAFRPLLVLAVLGAVGTYLFADVAIGLVYSAKKFGPAADNLRAFAPLMLLMYIDVLLTMAIIATGRANRLAGIKIATVIITAGLLFFLIPLCQARYANGGLGVLYARTIGELPMLVAACRLVPEAVNARTIGDLLRSLAAGAGTILLMRSLPSLPPVLAIPMCVLVFAGLALAVGAVKRSDIELLLASYRKAPPNPDLGAAGIAKRLPP